MRSTPPRSEVTPYVGPDGERLFFARPTGPENSRVIHGIGIDNTPISFAKERFRRRGTMAPRASLLGSALFPYVL